LHKLKTPKEWEKANKLSYLMQYASTGQLKKADEERIIQKMNIKPDMVIDWLHSPTPEHISLDLLEKARCHNSGRMRAFREATFRARFVYDDTDRIQGLYASGKARQG
jgi:hypothetical protein